MRNVFPAKLFCTIVNYYRMVQLLVLLLLANLLCKSLPKKNNKFYTLVNSTKLDLALTKIYIRKYWTTDVSSKKTNQRSSLSYKTWAFLFCHHFFIFIFTHYTFIYTHYCTKSYRYVPSSYLKNLNKCAIKLFLFYSI